MKHYRVGDLKQAQDNLQVPFELALPKLQALTFINEPGHARTRENGIFTLKPDPTAQSDASDSLWACHAVLRWLPGKRLVLRVSNGPHQRLAKIFFTRKDLQRELRGYRLLRDNKIATAEICEQLSGKQLDGTYAGILCYQWIDAPTLEQINRAEPLHATSPALLQTGAAVARMHRRGLRQVDIHPGNFLFDGTTLWVVDAAAVSGHRAPLRARLARENLADLLAQFYPAQIGETYTLWQAYREQWETPTWKHADLPASTDKMRALRWRHYRRKLTRSCSEFRCTRTSTRFQVWRRDCDSSSLHRALSDPDQQMAKGEALKLGNTATVASVEIDGSPTIIKRYNIKHWRHRLSRCWRPSRGWHSWHNAHFLRFNGLPTPRPIALIEERQGHLRGRAFFFCEQASGEDLKTHLEAAESTARRKMLSLLGDIITQYWRAGISHGDMKADNFIVSANGLTIIDLDPMAHHHCERSLNRALRKDVGRFLRNFDGSLRETIADELAPHLPPALVTQAKP